MNDATSRIAIDKQLPGYWRVTLNHPPINTIDDRMYDEVFDLVEAIEAEPSLKVGTFESANKDFFLAHYGVAESTSQLRASHAGLRRRPGLPGAMSLALRSFAAGRVGVAVSSRWRATCASPRVRKPFLVSRRSGADSFRAGARSSVCRSW